MVKPLVVVVLVGCGFEGRGEPVVAIDGAVPDMIDAPDGVPDSIGDAGPLPDAAAAMCPAGWFAIAGSTSRYLVANSPDRSWWLSEAACEAARLPAGAATHLVTLETLAEADALVGAPGMVAADYWVGSVQPPGQQQKKSGWRWLTSGAPGDGHWRAMQPDDGTANENDEEQFGTVDASLRMDDRPGNQGLRTICECDGIGVDSTIVIQPPF